MKKRDKFYVIITAGGTGSRFGGDLAKQFVQINDKPLLRWCIERFLELPFKVEIIVVINEQMREYWKEYCRKNDFLFKYVLTTGGITRFHSVKNAVKYLEPDGIVAVHDGVRPLISRDYLERLFVEAQECDVLVPVIPTVDSIRRKNPDGSTSIVNREDYLRVQTPQMFKTEVLINAYTQSYNPAYTDDASVAESAGYIVKTTEGESTNLKITTRGDLDIAQALINSGKG